MMLIGRKLIHPKIQAMALAILDFEDYNSGSVSERNNNPGNLKHKGQFGATGKDAQGHAVFDTFENGWNALIRQLQLAFENKSANYNSQMSLLEFFQKYAEANSLEYAIFVGKRVGATVETKLEDIIGGGGGIGGIGGGGGGRA